MIKPGSGQTATCDKIPAAQNNANGRVIFGVIMAFSVLFSEMSRKPVEPRGDAEDNLTETRAMLRASEAERKEAYAQFQTTLAELAPMEKSAAWLWYIAEHREADSDLESLVFLASREQDVTRHAMQLMREWKIQENEALAHYNEGHTHRPTIRADDIVGTSRVHLRDFWGGRDEQQLTIDATILRAVEWCQIGGFEHWWQRLAREMTEDVLRGGGFEGMAGASWLFAMCRSDYALELMPKALKSELDRISLSSVQAGQPWENAEAAPSGTSLPSNIVWASAIVFAEHRLPHDSGQAAEAIKVVQRHYENGAWPTWTNDPAPSVEATAIAMHALALAKPRGWQIMMDGARSWMLQQQTQDGYWVESGTPDPVFLTVLVLDAINLAAQPMGPVTFGRLSQEKGVQGLGRESSPPDVAPVIPPLTPESTKEERRAAVDAYIEEVRDKTGKQITRTDIWKKAGYNDRSDFERWERRAKSATNAAHRNITRVLNEKPHLKPDVK